MWLICPDRKELRLWSQMLPTPACRNQCGSKCSSVGTNNKVTHCSATKRKHQHKKHLIDNIRRAGDQNHIRNVTHRDRWFRRQGHVVTRHVPMYVARRGVCFVPP